ncbi:MAG: iron-sulfur cluster assembly scaffold protein, partial [Thermodesulfobacteriota bacterium]|nr:iron-sulfur cluster assembly scaffold protein [Thermodesulfobacteriota bacterium]
MENFDIGSTDPELIREMLLGSGYSEKAIQYFLKKPSLGSLPDANQVSEMIGSCGDTMKLFLKIDHDRIQDAKIQVLGCPGAVSSAMVAMEMIKGKTLEEAAELNDGDIFRALEAL